MLELAFIAACQSEKTADKILENGAKHVISTKSDKNLDDTIAIEFAKIFYKKLFKQATSMIDEAKTVC